MRFQNIILAATTAALVGCGGGSGSSGGGGVGIPAGTLLKAFVPNTTYVYRLTGNVTTGGNTSSFTNGIRQIDIQTTALAGATLFLSTQDTISLGATSESFSFRTYVDQDATTRNVTVKGFDYGSTLKTVASSDYIPGTFSATLNTSNSYTYTGGGTATQTFAVAAIETITVEGTRYETYRVNVNLDLGGGYTRVGTFWYSPNLGTYVKATEDVTTPTKREVVTALIASNPG